MQAVVLAAGAGRRLRPVTLARSKATVPVCGRSMVARVLDSLADAGVDDVVVVIGPGDDVSPIARAWAGDRRVRFAEQPERRGMADALAQAAPLLDGPFLLSACDSLVEGPFIRALRAHHEATGALATLAVQRQHDPERLRQMAVVDWDGTWIRTIVEKPGPGVLASDLGSLPLYLFEPRLLEHLPQVQPSPRGEYELQDAIAALIAHDGRVTALPAADRWQITSVDDLLAINRTFLGRGETREDSRACCRGPVYVDPDAVVEPGAVLGPNVVLEAGSHVGAGATVREAVVLRGGAVPAGATVEHAVVAPE